MTWRLSRAVIFTANQLPSFPTLKSVFAHMQAHLVFIILVQFHAALLRLPPSQGHRVVDIGLVNNLGYELRAVVNSWRVRGRDLSTMNGVGGAVFDEKGEKSED